MESSMADYARKYAKGIENSVKHIFSQFLDDAEVKEVFSPQTNDIDKCSRVWIEIEGTIEGEIVIILPQKTLSKLTKYFHPKARGKALKEGMIDVSGEIANLITGTLANQLQYIDHNVLVSPPEFDDEPIQMKALYENISISFITKYGGFDVELYYKDRLYS